MPTPVLPALGGATVNRKWIFEVNTNTALSPVWTVLGGLTNAQFQPDQANMVGDTDQAGQGFQSSTKTGATWSGQVTVKRAPKGSDATSYDTGQEFVRLKCIGQFGNAARLQLRVSEYDPNDPSGVSSPRIEAYTGFVTAAWEPQGGDMMAEDTVNITFQGQGALSAISHPYPVTPLVPTIATVTPSAVLAAGGTLIRIVGTGFTGTVANGVKVGTTACPSYDVESDSLIIAVIPAKTAGPYNVTVTNATGVSTSTATLTYS